MLDSINRANDSHHDSLFRTTVRGCKLTALALLPQLSRLLGPVGLEPTASGLRGFQYRATGASTSAFVHSDDHANHTTAHLSTPSRTTTRTTTRRLDRLAGHP
jgi:hypothetical protein